MSFKLQHIKNILVPTDFSPASWEATLYAIDLCHKHQAKMTLLHVVPGKIGDTSGQVKHMSQKLNTLTKSLNTNESNDLISGVTRTGMVVNEILNHLQEAEYDVVIMGVNGNGGMNKDLGKHARKIIESAVVPVRLVPNKASS